MKFSGQYAFSPGLLNGFGFAGSDTDAIAQGAVYPIFRYTQRQHDENRLHEIAPNIHPGFLCAELDLALRKP